MLRALLLALGDASAHDPSEDGALEAFVHAGALAGGWTTAGLVRWDGAAWLEVCGAALPGMTDAWLALDGTFLRAGTNGLEESVDGGCSFALRPDVPRALGLTRLGAHLLATTADPVVGVYDSTDDGRTFTAAGPFPRPLTAASVAVDGAGAWWLTASEPALLTSGDLGATWQEVSLPPTVGLVFFAVHGPGPHGGVLLTGATLNASTTLWESTATGWETLGTLPLTANHVVCLGATCLATLSGIAMVRWDATAGMASIALVDEGPVGCLTVGDDGAVWGCNARGSFALYGRTTDGFTFEQALAGETIAVRACPAGTSGESECSALLPPLDSGGAFDPDPAPPTRSPLADQGGGCATATDPTALGLPVVLVAFAARKRRRTLPGC